MPGPTDNARNFRQVLTDFSDKLQDAFHAVMGEFPAIDRKELAAITADIFKIAQLVHTHDERHSATISELWGKVKARITSDNAQQFGLPISILLWRYGLASIAELNVSDLHEPFNLGKLHKPVAEDEQHLVDEDALERATSAMPDSPLDVNNPACRERLHNLFMKNIPGEFRNTEKEAQYIKGIRASLGVLVNVLGLPASLGAGLTAASIPPAFGYEDPILQYVCLAIGVVTFSSIYFGARVELLSFNGWAKAILSISCLIGAAACSTPSAMLNRGGVADNIAHPPISFNSTYAGYIADGSAGANWGSNFILGQGQLLQVWVLLGIWVAYFKYMPSWWQKGIYVIRKVISLAVCAVSMWCYFEAGRELPRIDDPVGSYALSFGANITDFATITLAAAQLPWLGVFSSPLPLRTRAYNFFTGASIGAILSKYTYDAMLKEPELFDDWIMIMLLLMFTWTTNFHFYAPFGKYVQWLAEDVCWRSLKGIGNAIRGICYGPPKPSRTAALLPPPTATTHPTL